MKIKSVRIENFRSFVEQEIPLNDYSCFVGANGAGKSTVLCALNVFFKEQDSSVTDTQKLCDEDFFRRNTATPIRITLTFANLNDEAKAELADYVRQDEIVVTASATFDSNTQVAIVRHYGQRLGMERFRGFFEAAKQGVKAGELKPQLLAGNQTADKVGVKQKLLGLIFGLVFIPRRSRRLEVLDDD